MRLFSGARHDFLGGLQSFEKHRRWPVHLFKAVLTGGIALCFLIMTAPAGAAVKADFNGVGHAKKLYGDELSPKDLRGKVVFFQYWGISCPPCKASFPRLIELQEKYGRNGKFTVLASHVQRNPDAAAAFCVEKGVNFPVLHQFRPDATPCPGHIPHAFIIDHDGEVIAEGHPNELFGRVPELVEKAPANTGILASMKIVHWKSLIDKVEDGEPALPIINKLRQAAKREKNQDKAIEAKAIVSQIEKYMDEQPDKFKTMAETRPARTYLELKKFRRMATGMKCVKEVSGLAAELQKRAPVVRLASLLLKIDHNQEIMSRKKCAAPQIKQLKKLKKQLLKIADSDEGAVGAEARAEAAELRFD